jgi:cytochrome c
MHKLTAALLLCTAAFAQSPLGRPATEAEIKAKDFTVLADGTGLPPGRGDAARGQSVYKEKCAECHNDNGEGRQGQYPALVGGVGSLKSAKPVKTVGSYWPYATTLFDYIRRGMPYDRPHTLSADDVYAVSAFVLYKNGIVTQTQELNQKTLPQVKMPNRDGFIRDTRPDIKSKR